MQLVKKTDYEHFLTNLFLPDNMRKEAFAIRKHAGSLQILFERIKITANLFSDLELLTLRSNIL